MDSWVSGDDECKTFADGTKMKPSYVCYSFVFLLVVGVVTNLAYARDYPVYALSHATLGAGLVYVMYENCAKCNGWRGFLLTLAVSTVVGILLNALPFAKPSSRVDAKCAAGDPDCGEEGGDEGGGGVHKPFGSHATKSTCKKVIPDCSTRRFASKSKDGCSEFCERNGDKYTRCATVSATPVGPSMPGFYGMRCTAAGITPLIHGD